MSSPTDSENDMGALLAQSEAYTRPERGKLYTGTVVTADEQGVIVDLGLKRDGVLPRADVERLREEGIEFKPGETLSVVIVDPEDRDGNLLVSVHQAKQSQDWVSADEYLASGNIWEGQISGFNRGGLIAQFGGVRAFVPASHVADLPRGMVENERQARLASMVGQRSGFKVIEVDRERRRLVLSQRDAQREWRDQQKAKLMGDLSEGQIRKGVVTGLRDFGAFVDLGGADGLIHVSELSWRRVRHPHDVLHIGQEVEAKVIKIDAKAKRIGLSLKALQPDPWTTVEQRYQVGQEVEGRITRQASFGMFVDLGEGIEGLLHASQIPAGTSLQEGDSVQVRIVNIDAARQRIGLSLMDAPGAEAEPAEAAESESST